MIEAFLLLATAIYLLSLSADFFSLKSSEISSQVRSQVDFQASMISKQCLKRCLKNQKVSVRY